MTEPAHLVLGRNLTLALLASFLGAAVLIAPSDSPRTRFASEHRAQPATRESEILKALLAAPLSFEINQGQDPDLEVRYLTRGLESRIELKSTEMVLTRTRNGAPIRVRLAGADPNARHEAFEELPGKVNYLLGDEPRAWLRNVPTYERIRFSGVYPGIGVVYYGSGGELEYDFEVERGRDPRRIALDFSAADALAIEPNGDLVAEFGAETVRMKRPYAYQERDGARELVASAYRLVGGSSVGFAIGDYDTDRRLIIDPVLVYSTYFGGSADEQGVAIAVDRDGNAYVTGATTSLDTRYTPADEGFPATPGAFDGALDDSGSPTFGPAFSDAFVFKLDPNGTQPLYATYLGGEYADAGIDIAVDVLGEAFVVGRTESTRFPQINRPGLPRARATLGQSDAFLAKLSPDGSSLRYSFMFGGTDDDEALAVALDQYAFVYVTGATRSTRTFPTTEGALRSTGEQQDVFVSKFSATDTSLFPWPIPFPVYSTLVGGYADEAGLDIVAFGEVPSAVVTGFTRGAFPTTAGALPFGGGFRDAFVFKLNGTGTALDFSTQLGGNGDDIGSGLAVDAGQNLYIAGSTNSTNFPGTAASPIQSGFAGGVRDGFVAELNPGATKVLYATYLGGSDGDYATGLTVDASGRVYVVGHTTSADFPLANSLQPQPGGSSDLFVSLVDAGGAQLLHSSYFGGSGYDVSGQYALGYVGAGHGIAQDHDGNIYLTGTTASVDFPIPVQDPSLVPLTPFQDTLRGNSDAFAAKIGPGLVLKPLPRPSLPGSLQLLSP